MFVSNEDEYHRSTRSLISLVSAVGVFRVEINPCSTTYQWVRRYGTFYDKTELMGFKIKRL